MGEGEEKLDAFEINYENLRHLDSYIHVNEADCLDVEIERLVEGLWSGVGACEALLSPFFTTFLQSNLLRPLYIHYFALKKLRSCFGTVRINASTVVIDIVARYLDLTLSPTRSMHDEEFYLVRHYSFVRNGRGVGLRRLAKAGLRALHQLRGVDVLYLNAGKLDADLAAIPRAMSASWIPVTESKRFPCDVDRVRKRVCENIRAMTLTIPYEVVMDLLRVRVLNYLPSVVSRIGALTEFIERHGVRLVIVPAVTHEEHLCLLAAAKLAGVKSLILPHGVALAGNPFLHEYATYQATMIPVEPRYSGARQFSLMSSWFHGDI